MPTHLKYLRNNFDIYYMKTERFLLCYKYQRRLRTIWPIIALCVLILVYSASLSVLPVLSSSYEQIYIPANVFNQHSVQGEGVKNFKSPFGDNKSINIYKFEHDCPQPNVANITVAKTSLLHRNRRASKTHRGERRENLTYHSSLSNIQKTVEPQALEVFWTKAEKDFVVCRFQNVCLKRDGTLLIHNHFKRYWYFFRRCTGGKVHFSGNFSFLTQSAHLNLNLYGLVEARKHMPLFVTDVIPILYANELLIQKTNLSEEQLFHKCVTTEASTCPQNMPSSKETQINHDYPNVLHVEDRVLKLEKDHWVTKFSTMLSDDDFKMMSTKSMFEQISEPNICFNSIVSYSPFVFGETPKKAKIWNDAQERFFASNGLRTKTCKQNSISGKRSSKSQCHVHVLIINRHPGNLNDDLMPGRDLVEIEKIEKRIMADSRKANIHLEISAVYFEEKSFAEQVYYIQSADLIVGVHGAALTNLLFARKETPVLEVFPFFYFPVRFKMFSIGFNLKYSQIIAEPDPSTYFRCINYRSRNGQKEDIFMIALDSWREALRRRKNETGEKPLDSSEDKRHIAIRSCARSQRLRLNILRFSNRIVEMAQDLCLS